MVAFQLVQASDYSDSAPQEFETPGSIARPFVHGQLRFTCDGPTIYLRAASGYGTGTSEARISVYVDGVYSTNVLPAAAASTWYTATIPSGTHLVEVAAAQQTGPSYPVVSGNWIDGIYAPNLTILPPATSALWLGVDSDSIAASIVTVTGRDDWPSLLRSSFASRGRVLTYSWGFRGIGTESNHAFVALQMDRAARGCTRFRYIMALSTNDYGVPIESASAFGVNLGNRLQAIRSQFGSRLEQMYLITTFPRITETANSFANPTSDYRAQISSFAGADRVTVIDGTAMGLTQPTDYSADGLHPSDTGHVKINATVFPVVGGP